MDFNKIQLRTWSILGKRGTFGSVFADLLGERNNILAMSADFTRSSGWERFSKAYPDKFINVGIAEQNLIGIASGLASEGYNVFASSFAAFIATRSYEQVKIHCGYMQHNVKVVGLAAGFGVQQQGNTHYGLDDICLMRSIPNIMIVSPADSTEVVKATQALMDYTGPAYFRLCGEAGDPMVYREDYDFQLGKAIVLREGTDVAIFATGTMVYQSLQAAKFLAEQGVECAVVNIHTIRPIDTETILKVAKDVKLVISTEEGFITGGLGSAVEETLMANNIVRPFDKIGLTQFPHAGSYKFMLSQTGLDAEHIAQRIVDKLNAL